MRSCFEFEHIYLYRPPVDMRKGINGLSLIIKQSMNLDPFSSYLFLFCSRNRTLLKALYFDRTGFAIWMKRLEKDRFRWLRRGECDTITLTAEQLAWLLDGYDLTKMKPHQTLSYQHIY